MTPAARVAAAIELVDAVIVAARDGGAAADTVAQRFFAARRYAGSKDRRAIRDLAWRAIRRFGERPDSGRAAFVALADEDGEIGRLFDGTGYGPPPIDAREARAGGGAIPKWLVERFDPLVDADEQAALLGRAPLDLRVNRRIVEPDEVVAALPAAEPLAGLPDGLRLPGDSGADLAPLVARGAVEVQDAASQHFVRACGARPEATILDLCAGAGGKTLALGAATGGEARLIASDTARARLAELGPRAERAALSVEARLLNPGDEAAALADLAGRCDLVLVDAPCSGSGTWRRNPETRWRLTPARLDRLVAEQARLLDLAATLVAPGGRLAYATCSLLGAEGSGQAGEFLTRHAGWRAVAATPGRPSGPGRLLTPAHDDCDGFFFALLDRPC